jgi:hypothetical protein
MVTQIEWEENNPCLIGYQAYDPTDNGLLVRADVSSMKLYVWETETLTEKTAAGGETLTVNLCVFDTAQAWDKDGIGYNIRIPVSGAYLADAGKTYRIEVKITPASGDAYYLRHVELKTVDTYSA